MFRFLPRIKRKHEKTVFFLRLPRIWLNPHLLSPTLQHHKFRGPKPHPKSRNTTQRRRVDMNIIEEFARTSACSILGGFCSSEVFFAVLVQAGCLQILCRSTLLPSFAPFHAILHLFVHCISTFLRSFVPFDAFWRLTVCRVFFRMTTFWNFRNTAQFA